MAEKSLVEIWTQALNIMPEICSKDIAYLPIEYHHRPELSVEFVTFLSWREEMVNKLCNFIHQNCHLKMIQMRQNTNYTGFQNLKNFCYIFFNCHCRLAHAVILFWHGRCDVWNCHHFVALDTLFWIIFICLQIGVSTFSVTLLLHHLKWNFMSQANELD